MLAGGAMRGLGGLIAALAVLTLVGAPLGFGPLGRPVSAGEVSDPREMLARSVQAVLDAGSLQVDGEIEGVLSPGLVPGQPGPVQLDGLTSTVRLVPPDAAMWGRISIPSLDATIEFTTSWDTLWYRESDAASWVRASVGGVATEAGVDANPLTLVDRVRAYLDRPDLHPVVDDVTCPEVGGPCRRIVLETGDDPAALLDALLPDGGTRTTPAVASRVVVYADRSTLRPLQVVIEVRSTLRSVDVLTILRTSHWDDPSIVIEVPDTGP